MWIVYLTIICCVVLDFTVGKNMGTNACAGVNVVSRDQWKARKPKSVTPLMTPVGYFFIHHTETPTCTNETRCSARMRSIQNYHMDERGWADIGYSFLAGEDGNIYEGRGWKAVGAHTFKYNDKSLAVSFIGDYTSRIPNKKAIKAAKALIQCGVDQGFLTINYDLLGHRDVGQTSCPGDALYKYIRTWPHYNRTTDTMDHVLRFVPSKDSL